MVCLRVSKSQGEGGTAERDRAKGELKATIDAPGVKRVVFEDLEHGKDYLRVIAQYTQSFLCTTLENSLRAGRTHPINHVGRHAERNALWDW
jgi:hypothetical protein